jgi:uncharacterized protein YecE (DUF72 family)
LNDFRHAVEALRAGNRLLGLLGQFPQSMHDTSKHRAWIETLAGELAEYRLAVEFRHRSWFREDIPPWLHTLHVDLVSVDVPDIASLYPRGLVRSGPRVYIRMHSRNAQNWYRPDKERYDYDYDDEALSEWVEALARQSRDAIREVLFLFNNCHGAQAIGNARRLRELLARLAPEAQIIPPVTPSSTTPVQRGLFD